jgi:hypothetical protein
MKPALRLFLAVAAVTACAKTEDAPPADSTPASPPAMTSSTLEPVPIIDSVQCRIIAEPRRLEVTAYGMVMTGGWTNPTLSPRTYVAPPAGGIWEYDFTAVKPSGMVTQALTTISASHTFDGQPTADMKGVKVYGVDPDTKEIPITACRN